MNAEKKINYAIWLSVISLILWFVVVMLWLFNVYEFSVVDSNTFIGVIVALLALIVTFVVGWQIFNVLDVKAQLSDIADFKKQLQQQREDNEEDFNSTMYLQSIAFGDISLQNNNISDAFNNYLWAVYYSLKLKNEYIDELLMIEQLYRVANCLTDIDEKAKNQIINTDSKIRELPRFKYIKNEYEKAYNVFLSKRSMQS
jgi:hypothetical protein